MASIQLQEIEKEESTQEQTIKKDGSAQVQKKKRSHSSNGTTEEIIKLYAGLEKLATRQDFNENLIIFDRIKKDFEKFFIEGANKKRHFRTTFQRLFDPDILSGTITDKHRYHSVMHTQEDSQINGDTLLLRAMSINVERDSKQEKILRDIIELLIRSCPELIVFPKGNTDYKGITPVHLAILREDVYILLLMVKSLHSIRSSRLKKEDIQKICTVGPMFQTSLMMAGSPLGVAALKFNEEVFNIILLNFAPGLDVTNDKGDTIVHSLIKYACLQPDKLNEITTMLNYILQCKFTEGTDEHHPFNEGKWKYRKHARKLLMITNKEKLNALQLAAKRQQFRIFELIMQSEVYHSRESGDGLFNEEVYDITEIETLNILENDDDNDQEDVKQDHHESVMEYIVHQETSNAFLFVDFIPVQEVIKGKWRSYKNCFFGWFALHLAFMTLLSFVAVYRSKLSEPVSTKNHPKYANIVSENVFVTIVSVFGLMVGIFYIAIEVLRLYKSRFQYRTSKRFVKRFFWQFSTPYSNMIFRIYFGLFSLLLVTDCILASVEASGSFSGYENYCLIFAVIIGWYLVMFFLQTFKIFSMFTVLIQKAVLDMLKFALVLGFFLMAFSVAMFMIMQGADTEEDDFIYFDKTVLKMLTIMLGLGELGILFQARHPYLAIFVFVLFVVLTAILLLNALIAMMSNTCTDLTNNYGGLAATKLHCRLQKLSVILFLEGFLPRCLCKEVGVKRRKYRYHNNEWDYNKQRRLCVRNSVHEHNVKEIDKMSDQLLLPHQTKDLFSFLKQHSPLNMKGIGSNKLSPIHLSSSDLILPYSKMNSVQSLDIKSNDQGTFGDQRNIQIESMDVPDDE